MEKKEISYTFHDSDSHCSQRDKSMSSSRRAEFCHSILKEISSCLHGCPHSGLGGIAMATRLQRVVSGPLIKGEGVTPKDQFDKSNQWNEGTRVR